jgi:hypothetical protein
MPYIYPNKLKHMKNKVLFVVMMVLGAFATSKAQSIPNNDFENWLTDTNYLDLTLTNPATLDTAVTSNPVDWTTSNQVTGGAKFHNKILVTQGSGHQSGSSSIVLTSDSTTALFTGVPGLGSLSLNFVCPGFAVCGRFPINISAFASFTGSFNPAALPGAGIPVPGRVAKIGGYVKYAPQGGDTAYIVAVLRKGATIVAQAKYLHASTDAGFTYFESPFVYENCLVPDTMVYTLSSGNPYGISGVVLGGSTGLHRGSSLSVDSIFLVDTLVGFQVPPTVADDVDSTIKNTPVVVPVTVNDNSCSGGLLNVTVSTQPLHGTAAPSATGDSIVYAPAAGFVGMDTFYYTATVGGSSASAPAATRIKVSAPLAVIDVTEAQTRIYPNPAKDKLHVSVANQAISTVAIYDVLGGLVRTDSASSNLTIDLGTFSQGIYLIRFATNDGKVISTSRFSVVK